jgi:hypothetical protein
MCQKFHGAAFSTFAEVKLSNLYWISGYNNLKSYRASNDTVRQFCNNCGSSMLFCSRYNQQACTVELAIATLDNNNRNNNNLSFDSDLKPNAHIHISSKVAWLNIDDDLPKYKEYRDGEKEP